MGLRWHGVLPQYLEWILKNKGTNRILCLFIFFSGGSLSVTHSSRSSLTSLFTKGLFHFFISTPLLFLIVSVLLLLSRFNHVQLCATLWAVCSQPGSSVHGILQVRVLEWVAMPSFRRSSQSRNQTCISCIAGRFFTTEPPGKPTVSKTMYNYLINLSIKL